MPKDLFVFLTVFVCLASSLTLTSCESKSTGPENPEPDSNVQVSAYIIVKNSSGKLIQHVSFQVSEISPGFTSVAGTDGVSIPYGSSRSYKVRPDVCHVIAFFPDGAMKRYENIDMRRGGTYTITVWSSDAG